MQHHSWTVASWQLNFLALPWSRIIIQLLTASELNNSFKLTTSTLILKMVFSSFIHFLYIYFALAHEWNWKQMKQKEVDKERNETNFLFRQYRIPICISIIIDVFWNLFQIVTCVKWRGKYLIIYSTTELLRNNAQNSIKKSDAIKIGLMLNNHLFSRL